MPLRERTKARGSALVGNSPSLTVKGCNGHCLHYIARGCLAASCYQLHEREGPPANGPDGGSGGKRLMVLAGHGRPATSGQYRNRYI